MVRFTAPLRRRSTAMASDRGFGRQPVHMLDRHRARITDLGHANPQPDVIMTQIRDMSERSWVARGAAGR